MAKNKSVDTDQNIVKKVCGELNISQKELAEAIGITPQGLTNSISSNKISDQTLKSISLILENYKLKQELKNYEALSLALQATINYKR